MHEIARRTSPSPSQSRAPRWRQTLRNARRRAVPAADDDDALAADLLRRELPGPGEVAGARDREPQGLEDPRLLLGERGGVGVEAAGKGRVQAGGQRRLAHRVPSGGDRLQLRNTQRRARYGTRCAASSRSRQGTATYGAQVAEQAQSQVQSVDRALAVLDILARRGEAGVTELAAALDVHKSTASRLVSALEHRELVEQIGDRGKYRLGAGILRARGRDERPPRRDLAGAAGVRRAGRRAHARPSTSRSSTPAPRSTSCRSSARRRRSSAATGSAGGRRCTRRRAARCCSPTRTPPTQDAVLGRAPRAVHAGDRHRRRRAARASSTTCSAAAGRPPPRSSRSGSTRSPRRCATPAASSSPRSASPAPPTGSPRRPSRTSRPASLAAAGATISARLGWFPRA